MIVTVDKNAPVGSRIVSVSINDEPLDPTKTYKLGSNNFMLAGGDGYTTLAKGRVLIGATDGKLLANEVMVYVRQKGIIGISVQKRIVIQ